MQSSLSRSLSRTATFWLRPRLVLSVLLLLLLSLLLQPGLTRAQSAIWVAEPSGTTADLGGVDCVATNFCKAVGREGTILSFNGTSWSADVSGTTVDLGDVECLSVSFCKAVGVNATVLGWNGTSWSLESEGTAAFVGSVSCSSPTFCLAVGFDNYTNDPEPGGGLAVVSKILTYNGTSWTTTITPVTRLLWGVDCLSPTFCKISAAGNFPIGPDELTGAMFTYTGSSWSMDPILAPDAPWIFTGVDCLSPTFCRVGGVLLEGPDAPEHGSIHRWDGSGWIHEVTAVEPYRDVTCISESLCFAVGEAGWVSRLPSNVNDSTPTLVILHSVSCVTATFCRAVGNLGTIIALPTAPAADTLTLTATDTPDPVQRGSRLTYTVSVTNTGTSTAQGLTVRFTLPSTTSVSTVTSGWSCRSTSVNSTATVSCTRSSLAVGSTAAITVSIGVGRNLPDGTVLTATATVTGSIADPTPANNTATITSTVQGGPTR